MRLGNQKKKKNNKGFSLVELIVVVLIIAIIAVALAPQVMKWVGTAKTSVDKNNEATLKSAVTIAITDYVSENGSVPEGTYYYNQIKNATSGITGKINEVLNGDYPVPSSGGEYRIKISKEGSVEIVHSSVTATPFPTIAP